MPNTTAVEMPQMGESVTEATILRWHKQVGDHVAVDETLLEISTAKVEAEIPAPCDGYLLEVLFPEGATLPVDTIIARLGPTPPNGDIAKAAAMVAADIEENADREPFTRSAPPEAITLSPSEIPGLAPDHATVIELERQRLLRRRSTPLVRSMVRELGISIEDIEGTGSHGRVTKDDVLRFMRNRETKTSLGIEKINEAKRRRRSPSIEPPPPVASLGVPVGGALTMGGQRVEFGPGLGDIIEPMTAMRRAISNHMLRSQSTSAHAYTVFEMDMTAMMNLRARHRERFEKTYGCKLTPLAFITRAVVEGLIQFPVINASTDEHQNILYHRRINVGIAVAVKEGLIVPVIKHAESMTVAETARAIADIATRARNRQLDPAEVEGGTFTISSPGQMGALMGLPIISQPQIALLHVGGIHKRVAVVESPEGDSIGIRQKAILTLALDHRVIDGWVCDSFMASIRERLESADFKLFDDGSDVETSGQGDD